MINYSYYKPRIFPINTTATAAEIDRAQSIDPTVALNREKVNEIGRDGVVGYVKKSPTVTYSVRQLEHGNIEFWQKLANCETKGNAAEAGLTLNDFKESRSYICAYLTDDDATFRGTIMYPELRVDGFSLAISDPQAIMERNFSLVGESAVIWQGANKYFIEATATLGSAGDDEINLSARAPVEDPDNTGVYLLKVARVRSGVTTDLVLTTDYTYSNSTKVLTILSPQASDYIKVYYTSGTAPAVQFTNNDVDAPGLTGECASIYMYIPASGHPAATDYVYRLQSVNIDVKFTREDIREIGNKNVVERGIKDKVVTITTGRKLEQFTIEEVLRGVVPNFGKIDVEKLSDDVAIIVKIFSDNTKSTFKYGFLATALSPTDLKNGAAVREYTNADVTLQGENLTISEDTTVLGI